MPRRVFHAAICAAGIFVASPLHAQKPRETPTFAFSAVQLGTFEIPPLYYLGEKTGLDGKAQRTFQPLSVTNGSLGQATEISFAPPVSLYTGGFDKDGKPSMKPFLEIPVKLPKDRILLVFHLDRQGKGQHAFLGDSEAVHPAGSVRVVNFATQRIAFSVGGANFPIAPGGEAMTVPVTNSDGRFPFSHCVDIPGQPPHQPPTKLLRFRSPDQRLLVIYTAMPAEVPTGAQNADSSAVTETQFAPIAYRLYDRIGNRGTAEATRAAESLPAKAPPPPAAPEPGLQEQEVSLIAIGTQTPEATEIEIAWDGQIKKDRVVVKPDEFVRLLAPLARNAALRFAKGPAGPLGSARLGGASRQHLIVLVPGDDGGLTVSAFENSLHSHPAGGVRIFNMTPYQLAYSMGKKVAYINPKEEATIAFPQGESSVPLKIGITAAASWKLVFDTVVGRPESGKRGSLFVYKVPGSEEFKVLEKIQ